jgi:cytoskeletal protein RodZ
MAADFSGLVQILVTIGFIWFFFRRVFKKAEKPKETEQATQTQTASSSSSYQAKEDDEDDDDFDYELDDEETLAWKDDEEAEEEESPSEPEPEPATRTVSMTQLMQAMEHLKASETASQPFEEAPEPTSEDASDAIQESGVLFSSNADLQRAIVLKEILDKPKGLRGFDDNDW